MNRNKPTLGTRFALWMDGTGEGCDDTVACNEALVALDADTIDAARIEARSILDGYGAFDYADDMDNRPIERALILTISAAEGFDKYRSDTASMLANKRRRIAK